MHLHDPYSKLYDRSFLPHKQTFPGNAFDVPSNVKDQPYFSYDHQVPPSKFESYGPVKYPDLYINPNPQQFTFNAGISAYPVDTFIPQLAPSQKHEMPESEVGDMFGGASVMQKNFFSSDLENLLSDKSDDVGPSWMLPTNPPNKEASVEDFDYAIPSDFNALLFDLLPDAHGLEVSNPSPQAMPNDIDHLPLELTDLWAGFHEEAKDVVGKEFPQTSDNALSPDDPFVSGQIGGNLSLSSDPYNFRTAAPSLSDIYSELNGETPSPALSPQSVDQIAAGEDLSSTLVAGPALWDNLPELFEKNFDVSDGGLFFPPAAKRPREDFTYNLKPTVSEDVPVLVKQEHLSVSRTPSPVHSPPSAPTPEPMTPASPPQAAQKEVLDRSTTKPSKPSKGPLLFGKHEDDIIHKLFIPNRGTSKKPVTRDKLVSMPVEEFNHLLEVAKLTEIEVAFMKEWRRRGKNKTAAQVARKRKREEITGLDVEVEELRRQKVKLQSKYDRIRSQISSLKERSIAAEDKIYRRWSKQHGTAVSRDSHTILVSEEGKVMLVPKINSQLLMLK